MHSQLLSFGAMLSKESKKSDMVINQNIQYLHFNILNEGLLHIDDIRDS